MNLIQLQNDLQMSPDQWLQQQLVQPTGQIPQFLVMGELQRRKEMRDGAKAEQPGPRGSMAEEYARGLGQADVGNYGQAMQQAQQGPPPGPPAGNQPGVPPGQGPVGLPPGQPPGGMMTSPIQKGGGMMPPPQGFKDGGAVSRRNWLEQQRRNQERMMQAFLPGSDPMAEMSPYAIPYVQMMELLKQQQPPGAVMQPRSGGGVQDYVPERPFSERELRMIQAKYAGEAEEEYIRLVHNGRTQERMATPPGPLLNTPPIVMPNLPPAQAPQGPPAPPDNRTMLQRFQGAMANQSPDASVMAAEALRGLPPIDISGIGTGPGAEAQARSYQDALQRAQDVPNVLSRRPGRSLGQSIAENLQGRPSNIPLGPQAGMQDYPPDVPRGGQGTSGPEPPPDRPYMGLGGVRNDELDWLRGVLPGSLAASQPNAPGTEPPPDRPFTGSPQVPPGPGGPAGAPPSGRMVAPGGGGGGGARPGPSGNLINEPLTGIMDQIQQAKMPDRYAELIEQNKARKEGLKGNVEDDKGMALLTAGLGIMAGTSPNAMTNIGRGALLGVADWNSATKEMRQAERDIYNADQALAVAQANRDERQIEMAFRAKTHAEEMRERAAARASSSGDAAANRAQMLELRKAELEDNKQNRQEVREQSRITNATRLYEDSSKDINNYQKLIMQGKQAGVDTTQLESDLADARSRQGEARSTLYNQSINQQMRAGNIADARNMSDADVKKKMESGEWKSGMYVRTSRGIVQLP